MTPRRRLTNAEHQARWRARQRARLAALEQALIDQGLDVDEILRKSVSGSDQRVLRKTTLRKTGQVETASLLRKTTPASDEDRDARLTELRQIGDRLTAAYVALVPSLTRPEIATIAERFTEWKARVTAAAKCRRVVVPMKQAK